MGNGDLLPMDVINSIVFAISGGALQKQFAPLSTDAKISYLENALKDYGITRGDAENILKVRSIEVCCVFSVVVKKWKK